MRNRRGRWGGAALVVACLGTVAVHPAAAATGVISTFAGSLGQGRATDVAQDAISLALQGRTLYLPANPPIITTSGALVRALDLDTGLERVVAGTGEPGSTGDGGPATAATFTRVGDVAVDHAGNLYLVDSEPGRIRRVDPAGRITTFVGGGSRREDGVPAAQANLGQVGGIAVDPSGLLYFSDFSTNRVRRVNANGTVSTVAGVGGSSVFAGDGGLAVTARLSGPGDLAFDAGGNLYIADYGRVRRVDFLGLITTVAGGGTYPFGANDVRATDAEVFALGLAFDNAGNLLIAEGRWVRKVDATGRITTLAGNGRFVRRGDGKEVDPADGEAALGVAIAPTALVVDATGDLYATEWGRARVRRIAPSGIITTVAGNGTLGAGGDGGPARQAQLLQPTAVTFDRAGNVYIADAGNGRIRKVSPAGVITSLPQELRMPSSIAVDDAGRLYAVISGGVVVRVDPDGVVTRWAGGGVGNPVEGERATNGWLQAGDIAVDPAGNLYIVDGTRTIRKVDTAGSMTIVVGGGGMAPADGVAATAASPGPVAVAVDGAGDLLFADLVTQHIWRVGADGRLASIAGTTAGFSGDGGPATSAQLNLGAWHYRMSGSLAVDRAGQVFVLDADNHRVRRIDTSGVITTVAGNGQTYEPMASRPPTAAEGVLATSTPNSAVDIGVDGSGTLYLADMGYDRVRSVPGVGRSAPASGPISTSTTSSAAAAVRAVTGPPTASAASSVAGSPATSPSTRAPAPSTRAPAPSTVPAAPAAPSAPAQPAAPSVASTLTTTVAAGADPGPPAPAAVAGLAGATAMAAGARGSLPVPSHRGPWGWPLVAAIALAGSALGCVRARGRRRRLPTAQYGLRP